ncbi:hypothetical protein PC121_g19796 [Phytophthora cactorum]|nr:hypothetical protein PC120_g20008 [Phytophthora cactorum]KAG3047894.1 hypothetical protein PC121_g19796 [Phytophthora cactorum]
MLFELHQLFVSSIDTSLYTFGLQPTQPLWAADQSDTVVYKPHFISVDRGNLVIRLSRFAGGADTTTVPFACNRLLSRYTGRWFVILFGEDM